MNEIITQDSVSICVYTHTHAYIYILIIFRKHFYSYSQTKQQQMMHLDLFLHDNVLLVLASGCSDIESVGLFSSCVEQGLSVFVSLTHEESVGN